LPLDSGPQPLGRVPALHPDARGPQREEGAAGDDVRRVAAGAQQRPGRVDAQAGHDARQV